MKRYQTYDEATQVYTNWLEYTTEDPEPVAQKIEERFSDDECIYAEDKHILIIPDECNEMYPLTDSKESCRIICDELGMDMNNLFF